MVTPTLGRPISWAIRQRAGHVAQVAAVARLLGLVLQRQAHVAPVLRALAQAVHQPVALLDVIGLEGIVVAVLAVPHIDQVAAELRGDVHHLLGVGDRARPHRRILRRERAPAVDLRCEMIGDDRHQLEIVGVQLAFHLGDVARGDVPRAHDLHAAQIGHPCRGVAQLRKGAILAVAREEPVGPVAEVADDDGVLILLHVDLLICSISRRNWRLLATRSGPWL